MMHPTGYRGGKAVESRRCRWADATCSEVVSSAADGDQEAWNELHRRYNRMIARVASSSGCAATDVSDVQQAVWMRLLQHIHRLRQPDALGGWLVVVTRRECLRRRDNRLPTIDVDEADPAAVTDDEPVTSALAAERRRAVRQAVATLAPRRRVLVEAMLDHPELGYEQLASRLSMPVGSIGPTRQRCLDDLRERRELMDWRPSLRSA
jgi:RNA polymerase sigma factor (sigma-70 family)